MQMLFETADQAYAFAAMLYGGFLAGVLFDGMGLLRPKKQDWRGFLLDIAAFVLIGAAASAILIYTRQDALRVCALLGLMCGAAVYAFGVRPIARAVARLVKNKILTPLRAAIQKKEAGNKNLPPNT